MSISEEQVIRKIQQITTQAASSPAERRELLRAVHTLCELVLDTEVQTRDNLLEQKQLTTVPTHSEKKYKPDDGANGDSLFDF
ncbi:YwdI family protein [Bacillus fonticola]|uniref:YwdI family protein n=1 Tax=Bacillus fonticola TaxID=2728853 RepID=UPI0014748CAE|nr:YwdI family protein [Bacillus fonticola]